ncbi:hypothetical protein BDW62DRAFT_142563 [Aspergillus aurantiobrunneus]
MVPVAVFARETGGQSPDALTYDYRNSVRAWDIVTQTVCLTVSTICIGMRIFSKVVVLKTPGWEDFTCLIAWFGLIAFAVITIQADKHGNGVHQDEIAPSDLQEHAKLANASQILYAPLIFITKLSIFLLYLRLFAPSRQGKAYLATHLLIWSNLAFYLANFFLKIFQCIPRAKIWNKDIPGHCININIPILVTAAINVLSDLMMLPLPIVCVWKLQLSTRKKLGVSAIFAAGVFGCFASIMRLTVSVKNRDTHDKTYDWSDEILWSTAEVTCGIMASCLPALPTFFRHFFITAKTKFSHTSSQTRKGFSKERYPEKPAEEYALSPGRKIHGIFTTTERSGDHERGSDSDTEWIFHRPDYATSEENIGRNGTKLDRQGGPSHGHGILKTVSVDVESGLGPNRFAIDK